MNALINTGIASNTINKQKKLIDFNLFMSTGFSQVKPNGINISVNVSPVDAGVDKGNKINTLNISEGDKSKPANFLNIAVVDKSKQFNTGVNLITTNDVLSFYNLSRVNQGQIKTGNVIEVNVIKGNASRKTNEVIFNSLTVNTSKNTIPLFNNVQSNVQGNIQNNVVRAVKTVLWQGMATGHLSQIDSLTNYQFNMSTENNLKNINSLNISHTLSGYSMRNGVIFITPQTNTTTFLGTINNSKNNIINQKNVINSVFYKTKNWVNTEQILSQKMILTFSKEMKKLWIRDYFEGDNLTLEKSEQLLNKLNLFGPQQFDQIAVNGKVLWQSSDNNQLSQNNSKVY